MSTYMGNIGHLMQHWTLCELLTIAADKDKHIPGLSFIDAYAMAPLAREKQREDARFDGVRDGLPGRQSPYERAWHHLAPSVGYPNSAVFVEKVWKRDFALLLCETDWPTIAELGPWCESVRRLDRCKTAELSPGDWRKRFKQGLRTPSKLGLEKGALTLISFDPYKYDRSPTVPRRHGDLYHKDIELVMRKLEDVEGGILVQLSTYAVPRGDTLESVIQSVGPLLEASGFARRAVVRIPSNRNMMSLVYARKVSWAADLENLPDRFKTWLLAV